MLVFLIQNGNSAVGTYYFEYIVGDVTLMSTVQRFRYLNPYVKKGQIVFAGSSLMEQFPIYEFLQDFDLPYTIYNRGIGGYTTAEMLKVMDVCIYDLAPSSIKVLDRERLSIRFKDGTEIEQEITNMRRASA